MFARLLPLALLIASIVTANAAPSKPLAVRQMAPDFKLVQIAKDVYAFISGNTTHLVEDGNTLVIVTSEGVIVVDAPSTYLSRRHLDEIRKLTDKPVRYLINTHWHGDHVFGNHIYARAYPGLRIVANDYTARISNLRNPAILETFYRGARGRDFVAKAKEQAEKGVDGEGKPLTSAYDRERARRSYQELVPALEAEAKDGAYVGPNMTFTSQTKITLGGKTIILKSLPGHTRADTIVYLPEDRIVATGDLIIEPVPYGINSLFDLWIDTLDELIAMPVDAYVPGHGDVLYSRDYLIAERELFTALLDAARKAIAAGQRRDDFKKSLNLKAFEERFTRGDPERKWGWDNYFIDGAADRAFAIAGGEL